VIQEALTNALKHAGGAATRVVVRFGDGRLELEVRNVRGSAAPEAEGTGRGIVGMRQRVAVYGGELEAGPLPDGGFAVRARLPLNGEVGKP
jgi:signal transduction histidine kinase